MSTRFGVALAYSIRGGSRATSVKNACVVRFSHRLLSVKRGGLSLRFVRRVT